MRRGKPVASNGTETVPSKSVPSATCSTPTRSATWRIDAATAAGPVPHTAEGVVVHVGEAHHAVAVVDERVDVRRLALQRVEPLDGQQGPHRGPLRAAPCEQGVQVGPGAEQE